jgi:hypothetical protein
VGVLDDAIKQHLELKRRRGADPGEIKREEDEALGKALRAKRAAAADEAAAGDAAAEPDGAEAQDEPTAVETTPDSTVHQPTEAFDPAEVAEALGQMPADAVAEPDPEPESAEEPEPEPEAVPQHDEDVEPDPPEPDEGPAPSTEEPVAEEAGAESEEPVDEAEGDELEETPEFLEDAPEHDKLWFEQKPPKDFDF